MGPENHSVLLYYLAKSKQEAQLQLDLRSMMLTVSPSEAALGTCVRTYTRKEIAHCLSSSNCNWTPRVLPGTVITGELPVLGLQLTVTEQELSNTS
jgi:hypothetical protein